MSDNQNVAPPTLTRILLWDPKVLKTLTGDLYTHLNHALHYTPNEDGVYLPECSHKECNCGNSWDESNAFLTNLKLDPDTVIDLLLTDFNLPAACVRDLIHTYRLEEVLREIDYQRNRPLIAANNKKPHQWQSGVAVDAVLKITNQDEPQSVTWEDYFYPWEKVNFDETVFLLKNRRGQSGLVLNDIRKAYGIARTAFNESYFFSPNFVASCLIMISTNIPSTIYDWSYINEIPRKIDYFYVLSLKEKEEKWRLEGQRFDHGIFLVDEWQVRWIDGKGISSFDVYSVLKEYSRRAKRGR